jgi:hypothetical protein
VPSPDEDSEGDSEEEDGGPNKEPPGHDKDD